MRRLGAPLGVYSPNSSSSEKRLERDKRPGVRVKICYATRESSVIQRREKMLVKSAS